MKEEKTAYLLTLQPSQLYISSRKLKAVEAGVDFLVSQPFEPLPIKDLMGKIILTDGHTRALAAYRAGRKQIQVYWDTDPLDWEAYEICVQWCIEEGIVSVAQLESRIVAHEEYEELWYKRCRKMQKELKEQRQKK